MAGSTRKRNFKSWARPRHLAYLSLAIAVVVALVVAGLAGGTSPDRDDPPLAAAPGPGRALPGDGGGGLGAADASELDESFQPESTVDADPGMSELEKAGSVKLDVRKLDSTVVKMERPEHETE